jgi:hypothetical protein
VLGTVLDGIPESFVLGGREAGLVTALGFAVGFGRS